MNKKDESIMTDIATRELKDFVKKWKKNPYLWESETDVHAELYLKIKEAIRHKFPNLPRYKYEIKDKKQYFDRVYCKPPIARLNNRKRILRYPDIVVFIAEEDPKKKDCIKDKPVWACEIKYETEWSGLLSLEGVKKDIDTLKYLYAERNVKTCYLILRRHGSFGKSIKNLLKKVDRKQILLVCEPTR